jgi:ubiquinone/menaquinone biosynthesis C-methylase UbiE
VDEIIAHYNRIPEDERLLSGWGALEQARTQEIVLRHLPPPPGRVLDVGGGSGAYSIWLAGLGYEVHLVDLVPVHVEHALASSAGLASATVGDARHLRQPAASVDAVLLLGPLYHLTERRDRIAALREARRVLRASGCLFAAAISRFASLLDGLARGFLDDPGFARILDRDLLEGQHRNRTGNLDYFTTAYFHQPADLRGEIQEAGFASVQLLAVEGPAGLARDFPERWADAVRREQLLDLVRRVESEPALLGASPHLVAVAVNDGES